MGFFSKGDHSCVNVASLRAACVVGSYALQVCDFLASAVVLGRVDCSVCRSFVEIAVLLCALNVWATLPCFLVLQDFTWEHRFQVKLFWCCLDVVSLMLSRWLLSNVLLFVWYSSLACHIGFWLWVMLYKFPRR